MNSPYPTPKYKGARPRLLLFCSLAVICGLAVCFPGSGVIAQDASKEIESFFVAQKALEDGFYDVALGLLQRFINNHPKSARRHEAELLIGQCYFFQNKYLDALARFDSLLKNSEASKIRDACLYWLGEVHFRGNDFKRAVNYYQGVINEFPQSAYLFDAYYSLGWSLFEIQQYDKALEYFKIVQEKGAGKNLAGDASFKIAECLYYLKNYAELKKSLEYHRKSFPDDKQRMPFVLFYLAESNYYLADYLSSIEQYSKVIKEGSDDKLRELSGLGLIWAYLKLDKYEEAEKLIAQARKENLEKVNMHALQLAKGVLFTQTQRYAEAVNVYDGLINNQPQAEALIQAYIGKAEGLYSLSKFSEAIDVYEQIFDKFAPSQIDDDFIDKLYYGCGWAYLKEGEFKKAISQFQKVALKSADRIVKIAALCLVADTYLDASEYLQAIDSYNKILKDYPDSLYHDYVQYQIGIAFLKMGNYDGAVLAFKNLISNYPKSKMLDEATYALGLTYFQKKDYHASKEIFERLARDFSESNLRKDALYLLGTSFYNLEKFSQAIEVFKEIVKAYSDDSAIVQRAEYEIADCFYRLGKEEEAVGRFQALRSKYPASQLTAEVMWWLGEYYYQKENFDLARRYFLAIIRDFPASNLVSDAYYALGSTYEQGADYQEALKSFEKVTEIAQPDLAGQATIAIADIRVKEGNYNAALAIYQEAITRYANLSPLLFPKIAEIYKQEGNYGEAIKFYRRSLDTAPLRQLNQLQFKLADTYQAQGRTGEAIEEFLKLTYLYPEDKNLVVKSLLRVAQIYEDKDELTKAKSIYGKICLMDVEEAKYAKERIAWIEKYKGGS